jgi:methyl-accepting chemotaxis protein
MKSLRTRFFLLFTGLGLLISLGVGMFMYTLYVSYIKDTYRKTLTDVLRLVEKQYPALSDPEQLCQQGTAGAAEYWDIIAALDTIATTFEVTYIYLVRPSGNTYQFILSSEYTREQSLDDIFSVYDPDDFPAEMDAAYKTGTLQISPAPFTDKFGTFVSAYIPIFKGNAISGVLGADFKVSFVESLERRALVELLLALILASGISGVLAFIFASSLIKPIRKVIGALKIIAEGDLTQKIESAGKDELGEMTRFLSKTQDSIKALVMAIEDKAGALSRVGIELSAMMSQSAAAINQINATTQYMKSKALTQAASVTQTNAVMGQIVTNIGALNTNIEEQAKSVSRSSAAIEEMAANIASVTRSLVQNERNVQDLQDAAGNGHVALQKVSTDIQEVAKESERLLEINKVIQNIASQTNLLSMNAAIEAAHAGEVGKGFAVVADEIRKLAESSSEQAKTVSGVLKKIKDALDGISGSTVVALNHFEAIDNGVKTVSEHEGLIRSAMGEQDTGSREILATIAASSTVTQKVREGSEAMLNGSQEVIGEGKNLDELTADLTNGMNETATGMSQIIAAITRIQSISQENKEDIAILMQEITKFKVA